MSFNLPWMSSSSNLFNPSVNSKTTFKSLRMTLIIYICVEMNTELLCWLDYNIHYFIASVFQGSLFLTYSASAWHLHLPTARLLLMTACQIYARANKRFTVKPVEVKITSIRVRFAAVDQEHGVILLVALQQQWLYFLWRLRAWNDSIWLHSVLHALNTITEARAWSKVYVSEEWRVIINWLSIPFKNACLDITVLFYESSPASPKTRPLLLLKILFFFFCLCCPDEECLMKGLEACNLTIQTTPDQFPSLRRCVCNWEEELCGSIQVLATQCHQRTGAVFSI